MEGRWCLSNLHKLMFIIILMMMMFMVGWIEAAAAGMISIQQEEQDDERKALLQIKASLNDVSNSNVLPSWVNDGSRYCDWERINCNTTSGGYVTQLSLSNMFSIPMEEDGRYSVYVRRRSEGMIWPLNISVFLHFKELTRLDLSWSFIGNKFVTSGLESLSSLKKLEILNLSTNCIETDIFPSLSHLTSLKILDLSYINGFQGYSPTHDISEFQSLPNLEVLDLTGCGCYGTFQMQGFEIVSKLKTLNLGWNNFNESIITSLTALPSLEALDLTANSFSGPFPSQELSKLSNLKKLDLSGNYNLKITPSMEGCKSLMRLERLKTLSLVYNSLNKSIISCLSFIPSLNFLYLSRSRHLGSSFPMQELSSLRELKTLDLSDCNLHSITFNGSIIISNLLHLNLDENHFLSVDDVMRSMAAFPSLTFLSLRNCHMIRGRLLANGSIMSNLLHLNLDGNFLWMVDDMMRSMAAAFPSLTFLSLSYCLMSGRLFANEVPNLPYLKVLILSWNLLNGTLPTEG